MLLSFPVNSTVDPFPILAHLSTNWHLTNEEVILIQRRAVGILEDWMGACLEWVENPSLYAVWTETRMQRDTFAGPQIIAEGDDNFSHRK